MLVRLTLQHINALTIFFCIFKLIAYDYSTLGCVEITIGGREFSNTEEARINWLKILELLLFNGKCALTGKEWHLKENHVVEELTTFDELYEWFKEELKSTIDRVGEYIDMSMLDVQVSLLANQAMNYLLTDKIPAFIYFRFFASLFDISSNQSSWISILEI